MKTLYDDILHFDAMDKQLGGKDCFGPWVPPERRPWHDAAVEVMLRAQLHFVATRKRFSAFRENIDSSLATRGIPEDLPAKQGFLTLPYPVCWLEVLDEEDGFRQGFALEQKDDPWSLKLYTFQQHFSASWNAWSDPFAISFQTTMSDFGQAGWFKVDQAEWLDADEKEVGINNMRTLAKFVLALNPHFEDYSFSFETGHTLLNGQPAPQVDPEKIITANRERLYPFFELPYVEEPDVPSECATSQKFDTPKFN